MKWRIIWARSVFAEEELDGQMNWYVPAQWARSTKQTGMLETCCPRSPPNALWCLHLRLRDCSGRKDSSFFLERERRLKVLIQASWSSKLCCACVRIWGLLCTWTSASPKCSLGIPVWGCSKQTLKPLAYCLPRLSVCRLPAAKRGQHGARVDPWCFCPGRAGAGRVASGLPAWAFGACQESGLSFWQGGLLCRAVPTLVLSVWSEDTPVQPLPHCGLWWHWTVGIFNGEKLWDRHWAMIGEVCSFCTS